MSDDTIRNRVAAELAKIVPRIETELADTLVDRRVKKMVDSLVVVWDKLEKAESEFKKLGYDIVSFDDTGKKTHEAFSKKRLDERNKAKGLIAKLKGAINKAFEKNEWKDIYDLAGGKDPSTSPPETDGNDSSDPAG